MPKHDGMSVLAAPLTFVNKLYSQQFYLIYAMDWRIQSWL